MEARTATPGPITVSGVLVLPAGTSAELYAGPSANSSIIGRVPSGATVPLLGPAVPAEGHPGYYWYNVAVGGISGWVFHQEIGARPKATVSGNFVLGPGRSGVLFASPGSNSQIVGRVPTGATLFLLGPVVPADGRAGFYWYNAQYGGVTGWLFLEDIGDTPIIVASEQTASTTPSSAPILPVSPSYAASNTQATPLQTGRWIDPQGRFTIEVPRTWRVTRDATVSSNVVELDSGDDVFVFIDVYAQDGPARQGIEGFHQRHLSSTTRTYTDGNITDVAFGGASSGALMGYQSTSNSDRSDIHTGTVWYLDSGDRQFVIEAYATGATFRRLDEVNAIVSSIEFGR